MRIGVLLCSVWFVPVAVAQAPQWPGEQAAPTSRQRSEFAPPPGPYGRNFGAFPAGYFPWGWNAPASGANTMAPPLPGGAHYNPAEMPTYNAPQTTPTWPSYDAASANVGRNTPPGSARPDAAFNPGMQQPQWPSQQGYTAEPAARNAPPNYAPGYSQPPVSGGASQWQIPPSTSRQSVIYPGITPVESYAPQAAPVWPQTGYSTPGQSPASNVPTADQRGWPMPQGNYAYPESQAFPRR